MSRESRIEATDKEPEANDFTSALKNLIKELEKSGTTERMIRAALAAYYKLQLENVVGERKNLKDLFEDKRTFAKLILTGHQENISLTPHISNLCGLLMSDTINALDQDLIRLYHIFYCELVNLELIEFRYIHVCTKSE